MIFFFKTTIAADPAKLQQKLEIFGKYLNNFQTRVLAVSQKSEYSRGVPSLFSCGKSFTLAADENANTSTRTNTERYRTIQIQLKRRSKCFLLNSGSSNLSAKTAKHKLKLFRHQLSEYSSP